MNIPDEIMRAATSACEGYFTDPVTRGTAVQCAAIAIMAEQAKVRQMVTAGIMKAAEAALQQSSSQIFRGDAVTVIALAIAAERDRCASAARLAMVNNPDADEYTCSICAAAIRKGGA